jgi:hypothetical protein
MPARLSGRRRTLVSRAVGCWIDFWAKFDVSSACAPCVQCASDRFANKERVSKNRVSKNRMRFARGKSDDWIVSPHPVTGFHLLPQKPPARRWVAMTRLFTVAFVLSFLSGASATTCAAAYAAEQAVCDQTTITDDVLRYNAYCTNTACAEALVNVSWYCPDPCSWSGSSPTQTQESGYRSASFNKLLACDACVGAKALVTSSCPADLTTATASTLCASACSYALQQQAANCGDGTPDINYINPYAKVITYASAGFVQESTFPVTQRKAALFAEAVTALTHCEPPSTGVTAATLLARNRFSQNVWASSLYSYYTGSPGDSTIAQTLPYSVSNCRAYAPNPFSWQSGYYSSSTPGTTVSSTQTYATRDACRTACDAVTGCTGVTGPATCRSDESGQSSCSDMCRSCPDSCSNCGARARQLPASCASQAARTRVEHAQRPCPSRRSAVPPLSRSVALAEASQVR